MRVDVLDITSQFLGWSETYMNLPLLQRMCPVEDRQEFTRRLKKSFNADVRFDQLNTMFNEIVQAINTKLVESLSEYLYLIDVTIMKKAIKTTPYLQTVKKKVLKPQFKAVAEARNKVSQHLNEMYEVITLLNSSPDDDIMVDYNSENLDANDNFYQHLKAFKMDQLMERNNFSSLIKSDINAIENNDIYSYVDVDRRISKGKSNILIERLYNEYCNVAVLTEQLYNLHKKYCN